VLFVLSATVPEPLLPPPAVLVLSGILLLPADPLPLVPESPEPSPPAPSQPVVNPRMRPWIPRRIARREHGES